ncbi:MAG: helix-hairpin-helix domain-containing protein [Oscillospiraceae bacterium]|nr:helix-hairpin-helix domain-containing protein [Oscillospiraceae bacterium]
MRKPEKVTKSEIFLLCATFAFVLLVLILHLNSRGAEKQGGYTVRTQQEQEAQQPDPIDLNTADEEALQRLPGIGPALAERIVADRAANGPFASVEELTRVSGIGEKTVEDIRPYVTVSGTAPQDKGEEAAREDSGS